MNEDTTPDETVDGPTDNEAPVEESAPQEASPDKPIEPTSMQDIAIETGTDARSSAFMGVPIEVVISVGKAHPLVSDLIKLRRDSVISLDTKIDDPVELYIGDRLIARGELQEMESEEGALGVRLTEVADISNGV